MAGGFKRLLNPTTVMVVLLLGLWLLLGCDNIEKCLNIFIKGILSEINIMNFNKLKLTQLREIAKKLKFQDVGDRSGLSLRQELQHLAKIFIAGQVCFLNFY